MSIKKSSMNSYAIMVYVKESHIYVMVFPFFTPLYNILYHIFNASDMIR